jgi:cytoskeleton protein RodZ
MTPSSQIPETADIPEVPPEQAVEIIQGPGDQLRIARMAQGLSLTEVSTRLRLDVKHIEAIERDEFPSFMAPVFARGYLRNYAKLLKVPAEPIVQSYNSQHCELPPVLYTRPAARAIQGGDQPVSWIIYAVFLAVLFLGGVWWQTQGTLELDTAATAPSFQQEAENDPLLQASAPASIATPVTPATLTDMIAVLGTRRKLGPNDPSDTVQGLLRSLAQPVSLTLLDSSLPLDEIAVSAVPDTPDAAVSPSVDTPIVEAVRQTAATKPSPVAEEGAVVLRLDGDSWVEVTDANGNKIVSGILTAGTVRTLTELNFPLKVILGNSSVMSMEYGGTPLDYSAHHRANGVTRFTLAQSGKLASLAPSPAPAAPIAEPDNIAEPVSTETPAVLEESNAATASPDSSPAQPVITGNIRSPDAPGATPGEE